MKKNSNILNLSLIILIILFCISCKNKNKDCKKDGSCPPEYYRIRIGEEPKSYLWSLPGSYWIYKNSQTGELDTQTCTGFQFESVTVKGIFDYSKHITIEYDRIKRTIWSSYNKWTYVDKTRDNSPDDEQFNNGRTILDRTAAGPGVIIPFFYPFENGLIYGNGASNTTCQGMDNTMAIQGKTYTNVAKFDIDLDQIDEKNCQYIPVTTYFWAKEVGLIKKTIKNCNYSWELIEYNIIK